MAKLNVEATSKEIIKPSSPTPDHLNHYKLSFIDQISPLIYNSIVPFYALDHTDIEFNIDDISNCLKNSLSELSTKYYPLSGHLKGNRFIHCNDEGIPYFRKQVKCNLSDVIQNPIPGELNNNNSDIEKWGGGSWPRAPAALAYKNLVTFIDTPPGEGIEAYVSLKKEAMAKFESDEEFLTFVSLPGIQLKN
ncbi:hypothetical protein SO802_012025 [Lithocarpus litseifolius]|uniref:Uncharacterized protein n=1 Tax=Lithocarpus litseifolius TaxID=425828 RepID=A0AAW2D491_9ROSI